MHKSRRAIMFSRFSRNIRNVMAMAIQYTSNDLSTDLVVHQLVFFYSFPVALVSIPLPKSLSPIWFVQSAILILWKPVLRMLNYYHIPIYHNRAVPCRVARCLQPCWLGTVRHGFDRVYTSNFNRTGFPCQHDTVRLGTVRLKCDIHGISMRMFKDNYLILFLGLIV